MRNLVAFLAVLAASAFAVGCGAFGGNEDPTPTPTPVVVTQEKQVEDLIQNLKGARYGELFDKTLLFFEARGESAQNLLKGIEGNHVQGLFAQFASTEANEESASEEPFIFQEEQFLGVRCGNEIAVPDPMQLGDLSLIDEGSEYMGFVVLDVSSGELIDLNNAKRYITDHGFGVFDISSESITPFSTGGCGFPVGNYALLEPFDIVYIVGSGMGSVTRQLDGVEAFAVQITGFPILGSVAIAFQDGYPRVVGMVTAVSSDSNIVAVSSIEVVFPDIALP